MKYLNYDKIKSATLDLLAYCQNNDWAGYDPYDAEDFIIQMKKSGKALPENLAKEIRTLNNIDPLEVRKKLNIQKKINAKALGLLMGSYVNLFKIYNDNGYLENAKEIAEWLIENPSQYSNNHAWGYPFDWQSIVFIPKGMPSVVVSTVVGEGFWKLYEATRENKYFEICKSISSFILEELNCEVIDENRVCFSYTPIDNYMVHNANLFAAEFLIKVGKEIGSEEHIAIGKKAANYAVSEQNEDGSIFYWGIAQDHHNSKHLDSYHCGFEIRMLYSIYSLTDDKKYKAAYEKYLEFFMRKFVKDDGSILQFLPEKNPSQINIHGVAEAILLFSILISEKPHLK